MNDHSSNIGYWVKRYAILANQTVDGALKQFGIGRSQWYVLFHLQNETYLPQQHLQELLEIESATLTNLVASLVKKGLVAQQIDSANRRYKIVRLTARGQTLWQQLPDPIKAAREIALRDIAPERIAIAREVLEEATKNLATHLKS